MGVVMSEKRRRHLANPELGAGLRQSREWNGLTLDEVAMAAGVDPTWLSRAERGLRPLSPGKAKAVREAIRTLVAKRAR